ncbi:HTH domain-containing protein [Streptomyces sp. HD1123-B1]|uniref:DeoR family transcriptional regulator n=1 Tax=Streptomyces huangiella TaxID=3228804 RepID=UPI003D7E2A04
MSESDQHKFLSSRVLELLEELSHTGLYGFKETERKKFDFTCDLVRDWSRLISGQTLWKHSEGIDKDLRILLADEESKVTLYVARDTISNRRAVQEIISDTKKTPMRDRLSRLRTIWITQDFDADKEEHREVVSEVLRERLAKDLLISTLLGGASPRDVEAVGAQSGIPGLSLAIVESIATRGFVNMPDLAKRLDVSATTVRNRVQLLAASGILDQPNPKASMYEASVKGKVVLDICRSLVMARKPGDGITPEMLYVLEILGVRYVDEPISDAWMLAGPSGPFTPLGPEDRFKSLVVQSIYATKTFGIEWGAPFFSSEEGLPVR